MEEERPVSSRAPLPPLVPLATVAPAMFGKRGWRRVTPSPTPEKVPLCPSFAWEGGLVPMCPAASCIGFDGPVCPRSGAPVPPKGDPEPFVPRMGV